VTEARIIPIDGERPRRTGERPVKKAVAPQAPAAPSAPAAASPAAPSPAAESAAKASPALDIKPRKRPVKRPVAAPVSAEAASAGRAADDARVDEALTEVLGGDPDVLDWDTRVARTLDFLRRRVTGDFEVDDFGFDPELTDRVLLAAVRPLYSKWFRVETRGLENIPDAAGALLVANHSGTVALDSVMTQLAIHDHHPTHRNLRMLGANLVFQLPVVGEVARKSGATLACNADAERLLGSGELVGVWPEGFKGIGKPFSDRYKLQRFGRGGFVAAALRARVPIVPCSIVGAEEIYPIIGNVKSLARLLGVPYVPITPTFPWLGPLGLVPLPSKWIIEFGEPIPTDIYPEGAADDPMLVFNLTDQVRETIQHTLYKLLMQRRSVFF
jgi:1-acyl-sn-glycerol-3-phosphate acyltransferase